MAGLRACSTKTCNVIWQRGKVWQDVWRLSFFFFFFLLQSSFFSASSLRPFHPETSSCPYSAPSQTPGLPISCVHGLSVSHSTHRHPSARPPVFWSPSFFAFSISPSCFAPIRLTKDNNDNRPQRLPLLVYA